MDYCMYTSCALIKGGWVMKSIYWFWKSKNQLHINLKYVFNWEYDQHFFKKTKHINLKYVSNWDYDQHFLKKQKIPECNAHKGNLFTYIICV